MRRFIFWYLPLGVALIAACVFAYGFHLVFRNDVGTVVMPAAVLQPAAALAGTTRVLILGDSIARGTGDATGEGIGGAIEKELDRRGVKRENVVNLAVNGARTNDLVKQLQSPSMRRFVAEANVIVVSIGGNDLFGDESMRRGDKPPDPAAVMNRVQEGVARVVAVVRGLNPTARIFFVGLYNPFRGSKFGDAVNPAVAEWGARLARQFADDPNITVVQTSDIFAWRDRLSPDRFHPGAEGYRLIGRRIGESI